MRHPMYVKCGHCPACLQEKAAKRVRRIKDTTRDDLVCIMVALTYSRNTAPYVDRNEAYEFVNARLPKLNVYRDCSVRKVRKPSDWNDYNQVYKFNNSRVILDTVEFDLDSSLSNTKDLKHEFNKIGVCHYKDYQHFIARYRLNLKRHYAYENKLFVYACSEFGSRSLRPHFHLLIIGNKADKKALINAVYESWPFSDLRKFPKSVQVAYRASSYVASYVNSGSKFPKFFKDYFRPKHSYSKGFGLNNPNLSLTSLLQKFQQGSLRFGVLKDANGIPTIINVPFPSYAIHRYFPKFKGYTRIAPSTLVENMRRIGRYDYDAFCKSVAPVYLSEEEFYKVNVSLHNAFHRFLEDCPQDYKYITFEDYYTLHKDVWNCFNSTLLRFHMENPDIPLNEKYDNLDVWLSSERGKEILRWSGIDVSSISTCNPNEFSSVINRTNKFEMSFYEHIKHRNVNNEIYLSVDADCEL